MGVAMCALLSAVVMANECLVSFDDATTGTEIHSTIEAHCPVDTVRHEPCRLEHHAKGAVQLVGTDALLARKHDINYLYHRHMEMWPAQKIVPIFTVNGLRHL